jgi:hypothetical protein
VGPRWSEASAFRVLLWCAGVVIVLVIVVAVVNAIT